MAYAWPTLRLAVLVLTAVGIAGMHSLGHGGSGSHGASISPANTGHDVPAATAVASMPMLAETAADAVRHAMAPRTRMLPAPLVVCLAILAAGLVAVFAALRALRRRRHTGVAARSRAAIAAVRGPPQRVRLGLHLADLAVQRN